MCGCGHNPPPSFLNIVRYNLPVLCMKCKLSYYIIDTPFARRLRAFNFICSACDENPPEYPRFTYDARKPHDHKIFMMISCMESPRNVTKSGVGIHEQRY